MSVHKLRIKNSQLSFTAIPNKVLQGLRNMEALGLYCYLASLPIGWEFYKTEIRKHSGIGVNKLNKLLKYLENCNIIKLSTAKNEKGQFAGTDIEVLDGTEFKPSEINNITPHHGNRITETVARVSAPINRTYINRTKINKTEREKTARSRSPLSDNFLSDEKRSRLAEEVGERVGLHPKELVDKFRAVMRANKKVSGDWQAELELFLLREKKVEVNKTVNQEKTFKTYAQKDEVRSTVPWFYPEDENVSSQGVRNEQGRYPERDTNQSRNMRKDQKTLLFGQNVDAETNESNSKGIYEPKRASAYLLSGLENGRNANPY